MNIIIKFHYVIYFKVLSPQQLLCQSNQEGCNNVLIGETRNMYNIYMENSLEDVNDSLGEIGCGGMNWIELNQDHTQW
jgi:hypothetical protein